MKQLKPYERITAFAFALVAASLIAEAADAQTTDRADLIARADTNQDGDIAWSEVTALRSDTFGRLDRNADGVLNSDDTPPRVFAARFNEAMEQIKSDFDQDRDGEVTKDEMLNAPAPMFEAGDVDKDGVLTAEEMAVLADTVNVE